MLETMQYKKQIYVGLAIFLIVGICYAAQKGVQAYNEINKLTQEQQEIIDLMTKMS